MRFRPCIDIHNGKVKQIVGGSLKDEGNVVKENFTSEMDASHYAKLYRKRELTGGHVILLNKAGTKEYEADKKQAEMALGAFPCGLQVGGGITAENAAEFIDMGASHVIVTSYVFQNGRLHWQCLNELIDRIGRNRLVLDLSCRKRDGQYYVVTDRWQKYTEHVIHVDTLDLLSEYCNEFLIHAVDVEGKASGVETPLVELLGEWGGIPITYAGGIGSYEDIAIIKHKGKGKLDFTVGSALDLFGGKLDFEIISGKKDYFL